MRSTWIPARTAGASPSASGAFTDVLPWTGTLALGVAWALASSSVASEPADAAALLAKRCLTCHGASGAAPIAFDSPAAILRNRGLMLAQIREGAMPPWLPNDRGPELRHRRDLSEDEKSTLVAALATRESAERAFAALKPAIGAEQPVAAGAPGDALAFSPPRPWLVPASGGMRVRSYLVDAPADAPRLVRGLEVADLEAFRRGPLRFAALAADPQRRLARLVAADGEGTEAPGSVGRSPSGALGAVSRVATRFELPQGYAFEVPAGGVTIETLNEPVGRSARSDPRLRWIDARAGDLRRVEAIALHPPQFELRAGERRTLESRVEVPEGAEILGFIARGGAFLRGLEVDLVPRTHAAATGPTHSEPLLHIDDFRMAFAEPWILATPFVPTARVDLRVRFGLDNTSENPQQHWRHPRRVIPGLPPDEEDASVVVLFSRQDSETR